MTREKSTLVQRALVLALLPFFLSACASLAAEEASTEMGTAHTTIGVERLEDPKGGEMEHYVEAIDEELFVGVAVAGEGGSGEGARLVTVYLCDSHEISQWISGEISGQEGTLQAGNSSADVTLSDDEVSGVVTLDGGQPRAFTAEPAVDDAGVYQVDLSQGGDDFRLGWVILNDGRQRGPLDGKGNDPLTIVY